MSAMFDFFANEVYTYSIKETKKIVPNAKSSEAFSNTRVLGATERSFLSMCHNRHQRNKMLCFTSNTSVNDELCGLFTGLKLMLIPYAIGKWTA